jgi:hypothetical protein
MSKSCSECGCELRVWDDGLDWGYYCPECEGEPEDWDEEEYDDAP